MPYTKEHKELSRRRILDSASRLFSRRGFDAVTLDDLMHDAGLTRGAFYNHFDDKADVYAQAIVHAAMNTPFAHDVDVENPHLPAIEQMLDRYLSREHIGLPDKADPPCPLAFLVTDAGIREEKVRDAYSQVHHSLVDLIGRSLHQSSRDAQAVGLAVSALMIGGVAIGRALNSPATAEALLDSCRDAAKQLLRNAAPGQQLTRTAGTASSAGGPVGPA